MKVLVTGAAGFIGFHLCRALVARGDEVVGIDSINDYYDPDLKRARLAELGIGGRAADSCSSASARRSRSRPARRSRRCGSRRASARSPPVGSIPARRSARRITPPLVIWLASELRAGVRVPDHRRARRRLVGPLVLALSRSRGASAPVAARSSPISGRGPRAAAGPEAVVGQGVRAAEVPRHHHRPLPHRARVADLRLLDPALHGHGARTWTSSSSRCSRGCRSWPRISAACSAAISRRSCTSGFGLQHRQRAADRHHDRRALHGRSRADQLRRQSDRRDPVLLARRLSPIRCCRA